MSELTAERVEYRRVQHAESVAITEGEDVFLALTSPPPVRTRLRVVVAGDDIRGFEVLRVREVEAGEGPCGVFGRWIDAADAEGGHRVGSEHLEGPELPGAAGSSEAAQAAEAPSDAASEADPSDEAPTSASAEEADASTVASDDEVAESTEPGEDAAGDDAGESDDAADAGRARRGKKRKGRKRA